VRVSRNQIIIFLVLLALLLGGALKYGQYLGRNDPPPVEAGFLNQGGLTLAHAEGEEDPSDEKEAAPAVLAEEKPLMVVDIKGAVENPGVISLPEGSRLNDALIIARALPEANLDKVNLARTLLDGEAIYIPFQGQDEGEIAAIGQSSNSGGGSANNNGGAPAIGNGKVNINKASAAELQSLSGIGPAKAQAIINYREEHGSFGRIEDLTKVSGIGTATLEKIKNDITVD
jgi:competence protein ComEA